MIRPTPEPEPRPVVTIRTDQEVPVTDPTWPVDIRTEIAWHVETEQPDGTWEQSSAPQAIQEVAERRLASLRWRHPDTGHRLMRRTVTTRTDQEEVQ